MPSSREDELSVIKEIPEIEDESPKFYPRHRGTVTDKSFNQTASTQLSRFMVLNSESSIKRVVDAEASEYSQNNITTMVNTP